MSCQKPHSPSDHNCLWWVDLVWLPHAHLAALKLPFLNTWGGNILQKVWDRSKIKAESLLTSYCHRQNRLFLEKINILSLKREWDGEKQRKKLKHLPSTPFSQVQLQSLTSDSSTSSPYPPIPWVVPEGGGLWWAPLCCSLLLTLFPCSSIRSLHQAAVPSGNIILFFTMLLLAGCSLDCSTVFSPMQTTAPGLKRQ